MEQSFIENLDRRRYRLMLTQTVSFGIWFGLFLFVWLIPASLWTVILIAPMMAGIAVFGVASARLGKIAKEITSDHKLRAALNNELYMANDRKAGVYGYYILLAAVTVMYCLTIFIDIPGRVVTGILLLAGALGAKVVQLIVHRG